jgi:hypothetical protein
LAARYVYGIARPDLAPLVADRHHSATRDYVIDLFNLPMVMRRDSVARRQHFFGKAARGYL